MSQCYRYSTPKTRKLVRTRHVECDEIVLPGYYASNDVKNAANTHASSERQEIPEGISENYIKDFDYFDTDSDGDKTKTENVNIKIKEASSD